MKKGTFCKAKARKGKTRERESIFASKIFINVMSSSFCININKFYVTVFKTNETFGE